MTLLPHRDSDGHTFGPRATATTCSATCRRVGFKLKVVTKVAGQICGAGFRLRLRTMWKSTSRQRSANLWPKLLGLLGIPVHRVSYLQPARGKAARNFV